MCNKCGEKVIGEGSGCTAMEQVYHIQCFTCYVCSKFVNSLFFSSIRDIKFNVFLNETDKELRGKPFYAMESNPHCEECYLVRSIDSISICFYLEIYSIFCVILNVSSFTGFGSIGHFRKVFRLCETNFGSNSASYWQALSPELFHLYCVPKMFGWYSIHC